MKNPYQKTIYACFTGYIVQAIVNNFAPLLFVMFHENYGIPMEKITLLITFNFGLQLLVDLLSVGFVDRIGYRASMVLAHVLAAAGTAVDDGSSRHIRGSFHGTSGICDHLCRGRRTSGSSGKPRDGILSVGQ